MHNAEQENRHRQVTSGLLVILLFLITSQIVLLKQVSDLRRELTDQVVQIKTSASRATYAANEVATQLKYVKESMPDIKNKSEEVENYLTRAINILKSKDFQEFKDGQSPLAKAIEDFGDLNSIAITLGDNLINIRSAVMPPSSRQRPVSLTALLPQLGEFFNNARVRNLNDLGRALQQATAFSKFIREEKDNVDRIMNLGYASYHIKDLPGRVEGIRDIAKAWCGEAAESSYQKYKQEISAHACNLPTATFLCAPPADLGALPVKRDAGVPAAAAPAAAQAPPSGNAAPLVPQKQP